MHDDLRRLLAQPIAHRGLHACGRGNPIENSIGAAQAAAAAGYGIECDVQLSRDGEAIVFHDDRLERLTGTAGRLCDLDTASLRRLQLGSGPEHMPTLAEFLLAIDGRAPVVVEVKTAGDGGLRLMDRTLAVLRDYSGSAAVESFDPALILHGRVSGASRPLGLVGPAESGLAPASHVLAACDFLSWSIDDLAWPVRFAPRLPLSTWTIRTAAHVEIASRYGAQIVFEGFMPHMGINDADRQTPEHHS